MLSPQLQDLERTWMAKASRQGPSGGALDKEKYLGRWEVQTLPLQRASHLPRLHPLSGHSLLEAIRILLISGEKAGWP